jgi:hypothetical protein
MLVVTDWDKAERLSYLCEWAGTERTRSVGDEDERDSCYLMNHYGEEVNTLK